MLRLSQKFLISGSGISTCTEAYYFRIGEITETKSRQIYYLYVGKI